MFPEHAAHWHLILNHVPFFGLITGLILLLIQRIRFSERLLSVCLWWIFIAALMAIPVYLTGEPAEELMEGLSNVSHEAIETHEAWGKWVFFAIEVNGAVALAMILYRLYGELPDVTVWVLMGITLLTLIVTSITMNTGGHIRHPETTPEFRPEQHEEGAHEDEEQKSSAVERSRDGAGRAEKRDPSKKTPDESVPPTGVKPDAAPLKTIMVQLERNMQAISTGLWRHNFDLIARGADRIHGHPKIPEDEIQKLQSILGEDEFRAFVSDDQTVHRKARELREAAEKENFSASAERYQELQQGCVSCHQKHRDTIVNDPEWK